MSVKEGGELRLLADGGRGRCVEGREREMGLTSESLLPVAQ